MYGVKTKVLAKQKEHHCCDVFTRTGVTRLVPCRHEGDAQVAIWFLC